MSYTNLLPRKIKSPLICQFLDDDGKRCTRKARYEIWVLENGIEKNEFAVHVCDTHLLGTEEDKIKERKK